MNYAKGTIMPPIRWGPVDANISMLFTELPLLSRPAAAREAGFTAIEAWWPFDSAVPGDAEAEEFERAVRDAGVELVALNGFAGNMRAGDRGIVSWPGRRREFLDNLDVVIGIGTRLGCRRFNMLYGNRIEGAQAAGQDDLALENLADAARAAQQVDGVVLVEPLSGAPQYPLRLADEVLGVLDRLPPECAAAARLLADLYHLSVNGENACAGWATRTGSAWNTRPSRRRRRDYTAWVCAASRRRRRGEPERWGASLWMVSER
jgi:hydroxypyruvate isomerase